MNHVPFLFAVSAATACFAQSLPLSITTPAPLPSRSAEPRIPVHTRSAAADEAAYGIWAAGADYKARFDGGMTFVPALGSAYPHNQPWAWRTTSVRIGEHELVTRDPRATPQCTDYRVEYDLGGVVEAYDVVAEGLEQTFVIRSRSNDSGDLVVSGDVASALAAPASEPMHGAIVFHDANGTPILGYGSAIAIDANGERLPMQSSYIGGRITLRLAAEAVAQAAFPLCVDPLLSNLTFATQAGAVAVGDVDIAIEDEHTGNNQLLARTWHFSATDLDVRVAISDAAAGNATTIFSDLATGTAADHARVAYVAGGNAWVIAYQSLDLATQAMRVRVHQHDSTSTSFHGTSTPITTPGGAAWRPVVGGTYANSTGTRCLIAYQFEPGAVAFAESPTSEVHAVSFEVTALGGLPGLPFVVRATSGVDHERPAINRHADGGGAFAWFVVCQAYNNTIAGDDWDLIGVLAETNGTVSTGQWVSDLDGVHKLGPVVDGRHGRFCVAFSTAATTLGKLADTRGNDVRVERLDWSYGAAGPSAAGNQAPVQLGAPTAGRTMQATGIAYNGETRSHWTVATRFANGAAELRARRVGYRGQEVAAGDLLAVGLDTTLGTLAVAHSDRLSVTNYAWAKLDAATSNPIVTQAYAWASPALPVLSGAGCTPAGLSWYGVAQYAPGNNQLIGSQLSGLALAGAPANALHVVFAATTLPAPTPIVHPMVVPGCQLLVPTAGSGLLGTLTLAVGSSANWALPIPEAFNLPLVFQDWILDPATGLVSGTQRLSVPLAFP